MAYAIQLDLFDQNDSFTILEKRVCLTEKKLGNVQRGLFARISIHDEKLTLLLDLLQKQQMEIDTLKKKTGDKAELISFTM